MHNNHVIYMIFLILFACSALAQTPEEQNLPGDFSGIPKAPDSLVIDGEIEDWSLSAAIFISDASTQPLHDCSGVLYMMWDEESLYFAAKVYDDELIQGQIGDAVWQEDDVQFDLDMDREGDRNVFTYTDDDFQIGFSPGDSGNDKPEIWGWNPGGGTLMERPENAFIESSIFHKGWIIEARIGIDEFNSDLTGIENLEEGMSIGFGKCINDYDANSGDGGVSSGGAWMDTSKMVDVEFVGPVSVEPCSKITQLWGVIKTE